MACGSGGGGAHYAHVAVKSPKKTKDGRGVVRKEHLTYLKVQLTHTHKWANMEIKWPITIGKEESRA